MAWPISDEARRVWDEWNLRVAVLVSLFFQVDLVSLSNYRRRSGNPVLRAIIWTCYLLADWIAAFAVGLISSGLSNDCPGKNAVDNHLAAFWAPFLLLHLGGPDAITAFSLEDNELWIRHLFGLLIQLLAVIYVFLQSLPNDYWIPAALLFFAGACKYAERTISLYQACLENFKRSLLPKPDPGPNFAQLMAEFSALKASGVPVTIIVEKEPEYGSTSARIHISTDDQQQDSPKQETPDPYLENLRNGYEFYKVFKGLIVDHMFSFHHRDQSKKFFLDERSDVFQVMEMELSFLYDVLYTKMALVHCKRGYICRLLCTVSLAVCFQQFAKLPQRDIFHFDLIVSYVLLAGAIGLDVVGLFNLTFSDWVIVSARERVSRFLISLPFGKREHRWSDTISQLSFIRYCLKEERCKWISTIADICRLKDTLNEYQYKKKTVCADYLKNFIRGKLNDKAKIATTREITKEIYSARGEYALKDYFRIHRLYPSIRESLSDNIEYDESLLLWHIATELCYFTSSGSNDGHDRDRGCGFCKASTDCMCYVTSSGSNDGHDRDRGCGFCKASTDCMCYVTRSTPNDHHNHVYEDREVCKILSDYMMYMLVMRPALMSAVSGIAQIRFQDTCEEAKKFFKRSERMTHDQRQEACQNLLNVIRDDKPEEENGGRSKKKEVKPKDVKGDRSKSLLFDACILAHDLKKLGDKQWEIMSNVWVELLSYGASHCRASDHARQLSQGGEFITFVWLLMVHFGLGEQFRIEAGHARAKLLVDQQLQID